MALKWLKAVLQRKERRSTRNVNIQREEDILDTGDTRAISNVNSDMEGQEGNMKNSRIGLKWLREVVKRRGKRSSHVRREVEISRESDARSISSVSSGVGESVIIIERRRRTGLHRFMGMFNRGARASRSFPDVEWSTSYYTTTGSSVSGTGDIIVEGSIQSSEDLSIGNPVENPLLLPQEVAISRIYRPLKDLFEIRVLEILHGDEETVCCRLKYTSLFLPRDYNALSYAWGDMSRLRTIMVNGYPLQVTENCESALRELRREASVNQKQQIVWIDAICINQTDIGERTQQVRWMRDIYQKCQKLIVWLGPEQDSSSDAIQSMREMAAFCENGTVHEWAEYCAKDPNYIDRWAHIAKLISRSWFTRAWVFQEYVICARKARIHPEIDALEFYCGKDRISPLMMGITSDSFGRLSSTVIEMKTSRFWEEGEKALQGLYSLFSLSIYSQLGVLDPIEFFSCILSNLYRSATDPRDYIYAYLGFCKQRTWLPTQEDWIPEFSDLIVNYEASTEDVFSSLVRLVLSATERLDVLSMCYKRNSQIKTSWAIDLQDIASSLRGHEIRKHQGLLAPQFLNRSSERRYTASKDKTEKAFVAGDRLLPTGFRFERVYSVFSKGMWNAMKSSKSVTGALCQLLAELVEKTIEEARRRLWSVCVGGTFFEDKPGYYESWIEWLDAPPVSGIESKDNGKGKGKGEAETETEDEDKEDPHKHWTNLMDEQSSDRVIFVLKSLTSWQPTRIGKGWKTMAKDDIVYIVFGCDVPLVFRPVDQCDVELIGDCYVEGIMEGQAMERLEKEGAKEELLFIR